MIIIVEGIDRVGKTTLINRIVEECGFKKFDFIEKYKKDHKLENDFTEIVETEKMYMMLSGLMLLSKMNANIIVDRFHLSEFVYGKINRNYENIECIKIDKILANMGVLLIYMRPTNLDKSSMEHGNDLGEHLALFNEILGYTQINKIEGCYDDINYIVAEIKGSYQTNGYRYL